MVLAIIVLLMLAAIGYFHYVQGFFSGIISAVIAVFAAVVAVGYYETLVEGPFNAMSPDWMPALSLLGLFALTYVILRTIFDKAVPGQLQIPAVLDKVGGAVMGLVAGAFALGIVVIAAQTLPFGATVGGYGRYATLGQRNVVVPSTGGSGRGTSAKDAATFDEVDAETFDKATPSRLFLVPVDDIVVSAVAHLSDAGALSADKPFRSVHPDLLQELFGTRIGIETAASHTIVNLPGKVAVDVVGVYDAPVLTEDRIVDHEFKALRQTPVKLSAKVPPDEMRIVVRVKFTGAASDIKDKKLRISPGAVRIAARRPPGVGLDPEPHNYFPVGTLDPQPGGLLYCHKIDDFLFIDTNAKKADGSGDAAEADVDFVFQVKREGFLAGSGKDGDSQIAKGTFLEVKRRARVDLGEGELATIKPVGQMKPLTVLAVRRKQLEREGGPKAMEPGKGAVFKPSGTTPPAGAGGGGGALGQRLVGEWKTGGGVTASETLTFTADGGLTSVAGGGAPTQMRWVAAGPPQGETLTIKTAAAGSDPAAGEQRTIVFEDENQFSMTDSAGNRRFARVGSASAGTGSPDQAPDPTMSKMVGTWENAKGLSYNFRPDGTYTVADAPTGRSTTGKWRVTASADGDKPAAIELIQPSGKVVPQSWKLSGDNPNEIIRTSPAPDTPFKRKS